MASYKTLTVNDAAAALTATKDFEPLIVDGKLVAIIAGPLRIYASKEGLLIGKLETQDG